MKAYFHSLEPVVMDREDYIGEHRRLVKALESKNPELLNAELKEQKADLAKGLTGSGIKEDKRVINSKTAWSLASLTEGFLKAMRAKPEVPPSMKEKLTQALEIKAHNTKPLRGGLAGVSKASGFIQRMMAENKKKHSGQYKKPTSPASPDSTMKAWRAFDYKRLANSKQSGTNTHNYGASPFIQKYFKDGTVPFTKGNTAEETDEQKAERIVMRARRKGKAPPRVREEEAPAIHPELAEHFGNLAETPTPSNPAVKKKLPRVFVDADSGVVLHDERIPTNVLVAPTTDAVHSPEVVLAQAKALKAEAQLPDKTDKELEAIIAKAKNDDEARKAIEALYGEEDKEEKKAREAEIEYASKLIKETEEEIRIRGQITHTIKIAKSDSASLLKTGKEALGLIDKAIMDGEFVATNGNPPFSEHRLDNSKSPKVVQEILKHRNCVKFFTRRGTFSSSTGKQGWANWAVFSPKAYLEELDTFQKKAFEAYTTAFESDMVQDRLHPTLRVKHFGFKAIMAEPNGERRAKMFEHDTESPVYVRSAKSKALRETVEELRDEYKHLMLDDHAFIAGMKQYADDRADDIETDDDNKRLSDKEAIALQKRQASYFVQSIRDKKKLVSKWIDSAEAREDYNQKILSDLDDSLNYIEGGIPEAPEAPVKPTPPPKYKRKSLPPVPAKMTRDEKIRDILTQNPKTKAQTIVKALKELGYEGTAYSTVIPIINKIRSDI